MTEKWTYTEFVRRILDLEMRVQHLENKPQITFRKPSRTEFALMADKAGISEVDAEWLWNKWNGNGWKNDGKPIRSIGHTIAAWKAAGYLPSQKNGNHKASVFELKTAMEAKEVQAQEIRGRHCSDTASGPVWDSQADRTRYITLKTQIKQLRQQIGESV